MTLVAHYFVLAFVFIVIDSLWIAVVANSFYKQQMGSLLAAKPRLGLGALFYAIYIAALMFLVIEPALNDNRDWTWLLSHAAVLGFTMYATYDLTNAATLKKWPLKLTVVDMIWGTVLTTSICAIGFAIFG
ncbi:DUF2177 family protein [Aeromicrobium sp.]|nr:DUF2177 family protein [Candidatus Saccharibacteria bacterium]